MCHNLLDSRLTLKLLWQVDYREIQGQRVSVAEETPSSPQPLPC